MELLERDDALATLAEAHDDAARGIGPRRLRHRRAGDRQDLARHAVRARISARRPRVLFGTCDDLSIPRPLGPIRDLVGSVSPALEEALAAGAAPHEIQTLLVAELELPPRPTVLVLEDVHWADDATFDSITVLGRRIGSLPALLVLTFRAGEVPPGHPLHAALGAIRADDSVVLELGAALGGRRRRRSPATTPPRSTPRPAATRSTSPSSSAPRDAERAAAVGRERRARPRRAARRADSRRLVELVSVVPGPRAARRVLDAVHARTGRRRRRSRSAGSCSRSTRRYVRFRHELARNAIRSSVPVARAAAPPRARSSRRCSPPTPTRPTSSTTPRPRARRTSSPTTRSSPRGAPRRSSRTARRTRTTAAPPTSSTGSRPPSRRDVLEELAIAALHRRPARRGVRRRSTRAIAIYARARRRRGASAAARGSSRGSTGSPATATLAIGRRRARRSRSSSRSASRSSSRAPTAASRSSRCSPRTPSRRSLWGERALELATRLGDEGTRAHALVNLGTAATSSTPTTARALLEAHASRTPPGTGTRRRARSRNLGVHAHVLGPSPSRRCATPSRRSRTREEHEVHNFVSYTRMIDRVAAPAGRRVGRGRADDAAREIERGSTVPQLLARTVLTELAVRRGDADAAERLADLAAQADRAGELQRMTPGARAGDGVGADERRRRCRSSGSSRSSQRSDERGIGARLGRAPRRGLGGGRRHRGRARPRRRRCPYAAMARRDWQAAADASARSAGPTTAR